jgi:hypothetical protein
MNFLDRLFTAMRGEMTRKIDGKMKVPDVRGDNADAAKPPPISTTALRPARPAVSGHYE